MKDPDAFTALYRQTGSGIYRFALHMSASAAVAEEVTQETFLLLINNPRAYDSSKGPVESFLYGVARNLVKRHLERNRKWHELDDEDLLPAGVDPLGDMTQRENIQALRDAIAALPPKYREVIVLCDLQELSYESAASALGCAVGTVRSRIHRARALLIAKMQSKCLV